MKLLFIGDIMASAGRKAVERLVPRVVDERRIDLIIANAENVAGGSGITHDTARALLDQGIAVLTGGNHTWRYKEANELLARLPDRVIRPCNYPEGAPGRGWAICETPVGTKVGVLNLQGRVFMDPLPSPFEVADAVVAKLREVTPVIIVDIHAEATSEKRALGWYLDGRVSAVLGTHTHVPTADEEVLPGGTAYITDVGMTGPYDSVIGMQKEVVLQRLLTLRPAAFSPAKGDARLSAVVIDIDEESGRARHIERVFERLDPL